jgi:hypothetical protein
MSQAVTETRRITARCCCQDCSITVESDPALNDICHCDSRGRHKGGVFGSSYYFPDDKTEA